MSHELLKSKKGRYWFRSNDQLKEITKMELFFVTRGVIYWKWFIIPIFGYKLKGKKRAWSTFRVESFLKNEHLGSYRTEKEAADALAVLAKLRDLEVVGF